LNGELILSEDSFREEISGKNLSGSKFPERNIRKKYPEKISGKNIRKKYPEKMSGSKFPAVSFWEVPERQCINTIIFIK